MQLTLQEETIVKSLIEICRVPQKEGDVELEARFQQPIDPYVFKKILDYYWQTKLPRQKFVEAILEQSHTLDSNANTTQRTLAANGVAKQVQKTILKKPIWCTQLPVKIVLSLEKEINTFPFDNKHDTTFYAQKCRWRFRDNDVVIDLTEVKSNKSDQTILERQIEVELVGNVQTPKSATFKRFLYAIQTIHKIMLSMWPPHTTMISRQKKDELQKLVNERYGRRFPGVLPISIQNQASLNQAMDDEEYAVSLKLDGNRFILLIENDTDAYIMDRSARWARVQLAIRFRTSNRLTCKSAILFDVEIVGPCCYIFDVLANGPKKTLLPERLQFIKEFLQCHPPAQQQEGGLTVKPKDFHTGVKNKCTFIKGYDPHSNADQDGLIFTAIHKAYNEDLTDCLKWKLPQDTTIDFLLRKRTSSVMQMTYTLFVRDDHNVLVAFAPSATITISTVQERQSQEYEGAIVECAWDYELRQFTPKLIRYDKQQPNHINIALDAWHHILSPSTLDSLPCFEYADTRDTEEDNLEHLFTVMQSAVGWQDDQTYHLFDPELLLHDKQYLNQRYCFHFNDALPSYSTMLCLTHRKRKTQHWFATTYSGNFVAQHLERYPNLELESLDPHALLKYVRIIRFIPCKIPQELRTYEMPFCSYLAWVSGRQNRRLLKTAASEGENLLQYYCEAFSVAINDLVPTCPYVPNMQYTFVPHIIFGPGLDRTRLIKAVRNKERDTRFLLDGQGDIVGQ